MPDKLKELWTRQVAYNKIIRGEQKEYNPEVWTQTYLLGLVSEMDEVLRDIKWKRHRRLEGRLVDRTNLGFELADLTKYIISLWEVWGFTSDDMINFCSDKTKILERQLRQEFETIPTDRPILITDIDGTIGDWRSSFIEWAQSTNKLPEVSYPITSLMLDSDLAMRYQDYYTLKEQFESGGGYRKVIPYTDAIGVIINLQIKYHVYLIVATARPVTSYHRIWGDTWIWLEEQGIQCDQLRMANETRILMATGLSENSNVIMFEDDPGLILRAANSGIKVYARRQPYNEHINHKNVILLNKYTDIPLENYFEGD